MTQILPIDLPIRLLCVRVPVAWRESKYADGSWLSAGFLHNDEMKTYDAWEMRSEFLRLTRDDLPKLLEFLAKVGIFQHSNLTNVDLLQDDENMNAQSEHFVWRWEGGEHFISVREQTSMPVLDFWNFQKWCEEALIQKNYNAFSAFEYQVGFAEMSKNKACLLITTTSFVEAMTLSVQVDRVLNAKVRRCARPDCAIPFASSTRHKRKYCSWYCGHIESVRRERRRSRAKRLPRKT